MNDYASLFLENTPLMDVRAPVEFEQGHFPNSRNLPLMNDLERKCVGTEYKSQGQAAALTLGHSMVQGEIKNQRVDRWMDFLQAHPEAKLYCFRGGLRSEISQSWIAERGFKVEMVPGGYKAIRRFLLETLGQAALTRKIILLGGRTGSGKTQVLQKLTGSPLDLEKLANHKGSSFGSLGDQPAQASFENALAAALIKDSGAGPLILEDEGAMIGSVVIPQVLFAKMREAPLVVLEREMPLRIENIAQEYVFEKTQQFGGDFSKTRQFMLDALNRIKEKLGGLQHGRITHQINAAFSSSDPARVETHAEWIESLLVHYYDPLYDRGLKKSAGRICFQGDENGCVNFLNNGSIPR